MDIWKELTKEIGRNGTLEERVCIAKLQPASKDREKNKRTVRVLEETVCSLYAEDYTPAEVKGLLQIAVRLSGFQNPKL